jgi:hypothetical protein
MAEDINIMTFPRYVPKSPIQKDGTGYNSDTRQAIEPSFIDVQTTVDLDSDAFKYGFGYKSGPSMETMQTDPMFFFQDPLFPTYDIILDVTRSPLFIVESGSTYANSLSAFLSDYIDIYSMKSRQKIHEQFLKTLYNLFNTEFNQIERNKSYYINSITGLDNLTARIVDFEKQKITINLNEDISMVAMYLAQLYNNLSYSYRDQKLMIPYNLLRFNMYIKVHDVRNMPFYIPDGSGSTTYFDKSYVIYLLRDCSFDFKKAKNFEDNITVGGFDAPSPTKASSISFDIVYKSIEIESEYPLIMDSWNVGSSALKLNNKLSSLTPDNLQYNTVFMNNYKTPDVFNDELTQSATFNNDEDTSISRNRSELNTASGSTAESQRNYKFGVVSSDTTSTNREDDIKGFDRKYEPAVNSQVGQDPTWKQSIQSDTTFEVIDNYRTDTLGDKIAYDNSDPTFSEVDGNRSTILNDWHLYDPAVFNSEWNLGFGQSGPEVQALKTSFMNEMALYGFLFNLPEFILTRFFGGMHGLNPLIPIYINNIPDNIPPMENIVVYENVAISGSTHGTPDGARIDQSLPRLRPLDAFLPFSLKPPHHLDEHIETDFKPKQYLDGQVIPFELKPKQPLEGYIPFALRPPQKLSGKLEFVIKPKQPLDARIDTTPRPYEPVLGVIDTSFHPKDKLNIILDMTPRERTIQLNRLYENTYEQREIDLGLLYTAVTKEHLLPMLYLYSEFNKFNNLLNYKVYNNAVTELKPLDARIDQTKRLLNPMEIIFKYDNNIDMEKTIDNLLAYNNNVTKLHNIDVIELYGKPLPRPSFAISRVYTNNEFERERAQIKPLYNQYIQMQEKKLLEIDLGSVDTSIEYRMNPKMGSVYTVTDIEKKLLEPIKLYQPPKKSLIEFDLGELYEKFKYRGNIFIPKLKPMIEEERERKNVLEYDDRLEIQPFKRNKNILNPNEEERKREAAKDLEERKKKDEEYRDLHGDKINQKIPIEELFERETIVTDDDKERERRFLEGQKLETREDQSLREKKRLDHERLR